MRKGFTLAEVLITLTIIGVIAALTIPNLMQAWRKHERITQIKEAYSIIQNATKMAIAEHGNPDGWDFNGVNRSSADIRQYTKYYFLPYVKYQEICQASGIQNKKCFKENRWFLLNGNDYGNGSYGIDYTDILKLYNGMDIAIWAPQKSQQDTGSRYIYFFVDINGTQGPSKLGDDVFVFKMNMDTSKFSTGGAPSNYKQNDCVEGSGGHSCAYWIEKNHWEFPDNYPIKKF